MSLQITAARLHDFDLLTKVITVIKLIDDFEVTEINQFAILIHHPVFQDNYHLF